MVKEKQEKEAFMVKVVKKEKEVFKVKVKEEEMVVSGHKVTNAGIPCQTGEARGRGDHRGHQGQLSVHPLPHHRPHLLLRHPGQ